MPLVLASNAGDAGRPRAGPGAGMVLVWEPGPGPGDRMTELIMIEIFVDVPEPRCHLGPGSQTRASV